MTNGVIREEWRLTLSTSMPHVRDRGRMPASAPFATRPGRFGTVSGRPRWDTRQQAAFTLVELLIALSIMGILAAFALPAYSHYVAQSRQTDAQRQLMVVAQAQEIYRFQNGAYATNAQTASLVPYGWLNTFGDYTFTITSAGTAVINGVTVPVFTAQAAGNIDSDATIDTWTIDQTGTLINVINDVIS
jgi:type IV pilus assembly protein PilE